METTPSAGDGNREFIKYVAELLAREPEAVDVSESVEEEIIIYRLKLASDDVGRVIGRQGRIVRAIRSLLRAAAVRQGVRVSLEID